MPFPGPMAPFSPRRRLASTSRRPLIDYNLRSEAITAAALKQRGYDRNGWPYAPCGVLTRPNAFDFNCQRASFSCRRQCVSSRDPKVVEYAESCPHWINYHGLRLVEPTPRRASPGTCLLSTSRGSSLRLFPPGCRPTTGRRHGTDRHQKLKALRSAAERTNSSAKDDFCILSKPKVRGIKHAGILSQMAVIVVLLKKIARFIVNVTLAFRQEVENNKSPPQPVFIPGPKVPQFILNLVQRE